MSFKTNTIQVMYDRILNQIGQGGQLDGIKHVRIGSIEDARALNDFPIVVISLLGGDEKPPMPNIQMRDAIKVSLQLVCSKLEGENKLFNGANGLLDWHDRVLNVLDKNASGVPDVTFDGNVQSTTRRSYDIESLDSMYVLSQVFEMETTQFSLGDR